MSQLACIGNAVACFLSRNRFLKNSQTDQQRGENLGSFVMEFACNAFALFLHRIQDLRGTEAICFVDRLQHHIKGTGQLIRLWIESGNRCALRAFPRLYAAHDIAQVDQWSKGDLEYDEVQGDTDEPAYSNENDQDGWCGWHCIQT